MNAIYVVNYHHLEQRAFLEGRKTQKYIRQKFFKTPEAAKEFVQSAIWEKVIGSFYQQILVKEAGEGTIFKVEVE